MKHHADASSGKTASAAGGGSASIPVGSLPYDAVPESLPAARPPPPSSVFLSRGRGGHGDDGSELIPVPLAVRPRDAPILAGDGAVGERGGGGSESAIEGTPRVMAVDDSAAADSAPFDAILAEEEGGRRVRRDTSRGQREGRFAGSLLLDGSCVVPLHDSNPSSVDGRGGKLCGNWRLARMLQHQCLALASCLFLVISASVGVALGITFRRQGEGQEQHQTNNFFWGGNMAQPVRATRPPRMPESTTEQNTTEQLTERFVAYKKILLNVSGEETLEDESSPQYRALNWLANDDGYADAAPPYLERREDIVQRYVLAVLFFATGGEEGIWTERYKFLAAAHECEWYDEGAFGILGQMYSGIKGVTGCDSTGRVVVLHLPENNLRGKLPPELGELRLLNNLGLPGNYLSGSIPSTMYGLKHLTLLNVMFNELTGTISRRVSELDALEGLVLFHNFITGPLPEEVGSAGSGALTLMLEVTGNILTGSIPSSIGDSLDSLLYLGFQDNALTGPVPDLSSMAHLQILHMGYNDFHSSSIPDWLWNQTDLFSLTMPSIGLTETLPSSIDRLSLLQTLILSENELQGTIPPLGKPSDVKTLGLADNHFTGTLPSSIWELATVEHMDISACSLSGSIPKDIGALTNLRTLLLFGNLFYGTLPHEMGHLPHLDKLSVAINFFNGTVPHTFANSTSLNTVDLAWTRLTGSLDFLCPIFGSTEKYLRANCHGDDPDVTCGCCSSCCSNTEFGGPIFDCFPAN